LTDQQKDIFSYMKFLVKPGLRGFFLFFLLTFGLLLTLGAWQVSRLEWKNNLIQTVNTNLAKPTISLDILLAEALSKDTKSTYRRVHFKGSIERSKPFKLLMQKHKDILGYHPVVTVALESGARVLVDLGWVPNSIALDSITFPKGQVVFQGALKEESGRTSYTPENNYETHDLFSIDPLELAREKTSPTLLPFFVTRTGDLQGFDKYPLPVEMQIAIRNSHLGYAVTWYLLALFWLMIFVVYARRKIYL
jgi:surfeit locus 1 family protein